MKISKKENLSRAIRHASPQWVPNGMESVVSIASPVIERPGTTSKDAFGVGWSLEEGAEGGTYPAHNGHTIVDLACWREQITMPDLDALDWSRVKERADQVDREAHLVSGFVEMGLFERSYLLMGMDEALMAYLTEPELMAQLINAIADYKVELIKRFDDTVILQVFH